MGICNSSSATLLSCNSNNANGNIQSYHNDTSRLHHQILGNNNSNIHLLPGDVVIEQMNLQIAADRRVTLSGREDSGASSYAPQIPSPRPASTSLPNSSPIKVNNNNNNKQMRKRANYTNEQYKSTRRRMFVNRYLSSSFAAAAGATIGNTTASSLSSSILAGIPEEIWISHIFPFLIGRFPINNLLPKSFVGSLSFPSYSTERDPVSFSIFCLHFDAISYNSFDQINAMTDLKQLFSLLLISKFFNEIITKRIGIVHTIHPREENADEQNHEIRMNYVQEMRLRPTWWSSVSDQSYNKLVEKIYGGILDINTLSSLSQEGKGTSSSSLSSSSNVSESVGNVIKMNNIKMRTIASIKNELESLHDEKRNSINYRSTRMSDFHLSSVSNLSRIKILRIEGLSEYKFGRKVENYILITHDDLVTLSEISNLEVLIFSSCKFTSDIHVLGNNIVYLAFKECFRHPYFVEGGLGENPTECKQVHITYLPPNLQYLELCNRFSILPSNSASTNGECYWPVSLHTICVSCDVATSLENIFPLGVPSSVKYLYFRRVVILDNRFTFPENLVSLEVRGCTFLRDLNSLPPTLKKLHVEHCGGLVHFEIPETIETLRCIGNFSLRSIVCRNYLGNLLDVEIGDCSNLGGLPFNFFPTKLRVLKLCSVDASRIGLIEYIYNSQIQNLNLERISEIKKIERYPQGVTNVELNGINLLRDLPPAFPDGVKNVRIWSCTKIEAISMIPSSVIKLRLENINIGYCPDLPLNLKELLVEGCQMISKFEEFPSGLKRIDLVRLDELSSLPKLPNELQYLRIEKCSSLHIDFKSLPDTLEYLELKENRNIPQAISHLPNKLTSLVIYDFGGQESKIISLPKHLPKTLIRLVLWSCSNVKKFPPLPKNLELLELRYCPQIYFIGSHPSLKGIGIHSNLPSNLRVLRVYSCSNLQFIQNLPDSLEICQFERSDPFITVIPKETEMI